VAVTIIVPLPCVTGRVHERHVRLVARAEIAIRQRGRVLRGRRAFPRQRRLIDLQRARRDDAPVGGDLVTGRDEHDITDDQLLGGNFGLVPATADPPRRLHHRLQRVHGAFGLTLLPEAHDRVENRQHQQEHSSAPFLDQQRRDRRGGQDELHVAAVLVQEAQPTRLRLLLRKRVGPVRAQQLGGSFGTETARRVDVDRRRNVLGRT
jgi:hypothetical protein